MGDLLPASEPPEPSRPVRADALQRADRAWRARVAGASWAEVAVRAGFANGPNAIRAVREVYGEVPEVSKADLRAIWRDRLDWLWKAVERDVEQQQPGALVAGVRVAHAAARLDGLDAPSEHVIHNPTEAELERWVAEVVGSSAPALTEADIFDADVVADEQDDAED